MIRALAQAQRLAEVDSPAIDIRLDYFPGGYDRFGRIKDQSWPDRL